MPLTDIMMKLADGTKLSPGEREELRLAMLDIDRNRIETGAWIGEGGKAVLKTPYIFDPDFRTSPLHVFHAYMTTDVSCANNTYAALLFDTSAGDISVFDFWQNVKSKIRIDRSQLNISMDGIVRWEPSAAGDRVLRMRVFNISDVQIASQEISVVPPATSGGFQTDVNFAYTEDIRGLFPEAAYMILECMQNSGGTLNIQSAILSVRIA